MYLDTNASGRLPRVETRSLKQKVLPMPISITCSSCQRRLKAKDSLAGKVVACPNCGMMLTIAKPMAEDDVATYLLQESTPPEDIPRPPEPDAPAPPERPRPQPRPVAPPKPVVMNLMP